MYINLLPFNSNPHSAAHNDHYSGHLRRSPHYPLSRAIHDSAARVRRALRRSSASRHRARNTAPSMSWWD